MKKATFPENRIDVVSMLAEIDYSLNDITQLNIAEHGEIVTMSRTTALRAEQEERRVIISFNTRIFQGNPVIIIDIEQFENRLHDALTSDEYPVYSTVFKVEDYVEYSGEIKESFEASLQTLTAFYKS
ncbi:hypothetical protein [Enterobacter hormaechei]|uniref:hypothetical protein n=1 Tax=Enterobacter hormaechei TaxID=158836 RepID=UPI0015D477F9|nr:hypothetical protein [Enterobacter hormaechei]